MSHEPECFIEGLYPAPNCRLCELLRSAYKRGREDAAQAIESHPESLDGKYIRWYIAADAVRGNGEQQ